MKIKHDKRGKISSEFIKNFIRATDAGEATARTYSNALKRFCIYLEQNNNKSPTRDDIINFREYLKNENKSAATVQLYLVALRRFFEWMETAGHCDNVAAGIKGPKPGSVFVKDWLTAENASRLLDSIDRASLIGKRDYALIILMLTTGIRTIEAVRANRNDMRQTAGGMALFIQGKGHDSKDNYVKLVDVAEMAIKSYLEARKTLDPCEAALFSSLSRRGSGRMTTRSIRRIIRRRLLAIGLDSCLLSAHSLRHTAATLNLKNGGTLEETKQLLRHKNINTTMRYSHALERANNESESRIAGAIFFKKGQMSAKYNYGT